jgi:DNA-binding SARP family transcriptional activator
MSVRVQPDVLARPSTSDQVRLSLLEGFELRRGGLRVPLPTTAQRLVVFLALQRRPVLRSYVAGNLWAEATEVHATASLRSALWRLRRADQRLIEANVTHLRIAKEVAVDYEQTTSWARRLIDDPSIAPSLDLDTAGLASELLPDWSEDWVLLERERFRQLRLHALEVLCSQLADMGHYVQALEAGLTAVGCEPLRESAHKLLIQVHLAEGNRNEALRQYRTYRQLLKDDLGLPPSPELTLLVHNMAGE